MLLKATLCVYVISLLIISCWCEDFNCESKETCSECIQTLGCKWCSAPEHENNCVNRNVSDAGWCKINLITDPQSSIQIISDKDLSSAKNNVIQMKPQRIKLSLRRGEEFEIPFQYAQATNYPVDLYYIMDLSHSMESHREKLGKLGDKLAKTMNNITNNFRLGFGSFVDKVDLPFVSTVPSKLLQPCTINKADGQSQKCVAPYSFKNHMSLTSDYKKFSMEVSEAKVSGNLDTPEGGFDAIMQAIVCKKEIGWRSQARHLLVFSTDAEFHIAGDGKLAGVVEPNDATCHMENNIYTESLTYDYPSVSQINYVAKENNINIIFAIVKKPSVIDSYKKLSVRIENSETGALDERSENVIKLVVDNYNRIVDSVTISANSSRDVEVKISSNCPQPKENGCTNITVGKIVDFTATIKALECSSSKRKTISIKPEGIEESLLIDLEVTCDCDCSKDSIPNSPFCSNHGNLNCGVCECDSERFGRKCECDRYDHSENTNQTNCLAPNDTKICSGLGTCKCGKCECNKRSKPGEKIYGKFCDCDNYSCKRSDGLLCSNRGTCGCGGVCTCQPGWTGDACQCPDTNSTCIKPGGDSSICNGHGTCSCGKCECFEEAVRYSGKYCDECPTCAGQRCEELRHCVECQVYKTGKYDKNQCQIECTAFTTQKVNKIDNVDDEDVKICTIPDENGCTFVFSYEYGENRELIVKAEKKKSCSGPPPVLAWVLGVIGTIFLAGLILLIIWKVCTTIHDRREYAKFENERQKLKWHRNDNPLYKQATSTFSNPVYNRSNHRYSFKNK